MALGPRVDLRLDANEAWPSGGLARPGAAALAVSLAALEQPVPHAEVQALADLRGGWVCR